MLRGAPVSQRRVVVRILLLGIFSVFSPEAATAVSLGQVALGEPPPGGRLLSLAQLPAEKASSSTEMAEERPDLAPIQQQLWSSPQALAHTAKHNLSVLLGRLDWEKLRMGLTLAFFLLTMLTCAALARQVNALMKRAQKYTQLHEGSAAAKPPLLCAARQSDKSGRAAAPRPTSEDDDASSDLCWSEASEQAFELKQQIKDLERRLRTQKRLLFDDNPRRPPAVGGAAATAAAKNAGRTTRASGQGLRGQEQALGWVTVV